MFCVEKCTKKARKLAFRIIFKKKGLLFAVFSIKYGVSWHFHGKFEL